MDVWVEELKQKAASAAIDEYAVRINHLFEGWYYNEVGQLQEQLSVKQLMRAAFEQGRLIGLEEGIKNEGL